MNGKRKFVKAGRWHFAIDDIACYGTYLTADEDRYGFVVMKGDEVEFVLPQAEYSELALALASLNLPVPSD